MPGAGQGDHAAMAVTALYREHALDLTRLAFLMLGDRPAAEDVVQDAFCGLYRAWDRLTTHDTGALLRTAAPWTVVNGLDTAVLPPRSAVG